jgi:hypothetical protein
VKLCVAAHRLVTPLLLGLLLVGWLPARPVMAQEAPTTSPTDQAGTEVYGAPEEPTPMFEPVDTEATPAPMFEPVEGEATPAPTMLDTDAAPLFEPQPRQPARLAVDVLAPSSVRAGQELTYTVLYTNTTGNPLNEAWLDVALSPIGTPPIQAYVRTVEAPSQNPRLGNSEPITITTNGS